MSKIRHNATHGAVNDAPELEQDLVEQDEEIEQDEIQELSGTPADWSSMGGDEESAPDAENPSDLDESDPEGDPDAYDDQGDEAEETYVIS